MIAYDNYDCSFRQDSWKDRWKDRQDLLQKYHLINISYSWHYFNDLKTMKKHDNYDFLLTKKKR